MIKHRYSKEGLTLVELIVATAILIVAFVGILISYIRCLELSELSRNSSNSLNAAKSKIEEIKNTVFANIEGTYNNVTFVLPANVNGSGVSYVDSTNPDLLEVTVTVCWSQSNGRVVGEDANLNGVLNAGEDSNANGQLDSPVQLVTFIYDR